MTRRQRERRWVISYTALQDNGHRRRRHAYFASKESAEEGIAWRLQHPHHWGDICRLNWPDGQHGLVVPK